MCFNSVNIRTVFKVSLETYKSVFKMTFYKKADQYIMMLCILTITVFKNEIGAVLLSSPLLY